MNRIEIVELIKSGVKPYFQIAEAKCFFNISEKTLKLYANKNGLFENPAKLKTKTKKSDVLKAKETLKVMQELGYPKLNKKAVVDATA